MKHFSFITENEHHDRIFHNVLYDSNSGHIFFAIERSELLCYPEHENIKKDLHELTKQLNENEIYDSKIINNIKNYLYSCRLKKLKRILE